jgi:hypothetical protein
MMGISSDEKLLYPLDESGESFCTNLLSSSVGKKEQTSQNEKDSALGTPQSFIMILRCVYRASTSHY